MSFWNFIGEFAVFNMICNFFSGKSKIHHVSTCQPQYIPNPQYEARIEELEQEIKESEKRLAEYKKIIGSNFYADLDDINELQDRIDELERQLYDCDVMSDRHDRIQDEINMLQDRIVDMEDMEGIDDMEVDLDCFRDDLYDMDFSGDD